MDTHAREQAAKHGVTISEMGFVNPFFASYDSNVHAMLVAELGAGLD
jgi:hypothetical protein